MVEVWASATIATLAFVLGSAGIAKLRHGTAAFGHRVQAGVEIGVAAAALCLATRPVGCVLSATFAGFAVVHARRRGREPDAGCACFGEPTGLAGEAGRRRLVLTGASAGAAALVAVLAPRGPLSLLVHRPVSGVTALVIAALAAQLWRTGFAGPRESISPGDRLVTSSAQFLERRFSRRGLLVRLAAAGSALAVAPLRFLLYPGTALAAISPAECGGGACTDGYTAFCCQIHHGLNSCPTDTFAGGWWMCTDYPGRNLCAGEGVRYYVDCNAMPGREFPGGCRCAGGSCENQRVACNVFRYGQCNTHIGGVTAVVCRMVVCENPSTISELHCSASMAVDDAVCAQDTPCLEPAVPVGAPGGV